MTGRCSAAISASRTVRESKSGAMRFAGGFRSAFRMLVGHARESTVDRHAEYPVRALEWPGVRAGLHRPLPGTRPERPQFHTALDFLRLGVSGAERFFRPATC